MRKIIIVINILIVVVFSCNALYSQSKTNTEDIFKMYLFLNKKNIYRSDINNNIIKNDSLYDLFYKKSILEIDTIKLHSNIYLPIEAHYTFFKLKKIRYSIDLERDKKQQINIDICEFSNYIIAINNHTGTSFRLSGFYNNDFINFLIHIKKSYRDSNFKELKNSNFFRNYIVEGLDFKCIYKGLIGKKTDKENFKCLHTCDEGLKLW